MRSIFVVVMDGEVEQVTTMEGENWHTFIEPTPASLSRLRSLLRTGLVDCVVRHTHRDQDWIDAWKNDKRRRKELGLSNTNKVSSR